jgi:hypothetical protein
VSFRHSSARSVPSCGVWSKLTGCLGLELLHRAAVLDRFPFPPWDQRIKACPVLPYARHVDPRLKRDTAAYGPQTRRYPALGSVQRTKEKELTSAHDRLNADRR